MIHFLKLFILFIAFIVPFHGIAQVTEITKTDSTTVVLRWQNNQSTLLDFYGENIVRIFQDSTGKQPRTPEAKPEAQILAAHPRKPVPGIRYNKGTMETTVATSKITVVINNSSGRISIKNNTTNRTIVQFSKPFSIGADKTAIELITDPGEYFFGGGVQNGRFSHKGKVIAIENQSSWTDGGVASPTPFFWSTNGYGFMWHTFKKGRYDFGATEKNAINLYHEVNYLDVFFMINDGAIPLLNDFYQLTGNPVLIPKFGFYQGHLNAYNRDYWKPDTTGSGMLFEDGKRYKESQKDNGGIKESLNGEGNNYPFSARAVIDRYKKYDMPLGWILPNDGYGAGYGQTGTLDSNIQNLKSFGDYARKNGVQIGLWTQSDLHPIDSISALLQRDIVKEVGTAGVNVLKTDVAWVGPGYSFGLAGIADAAGIMTRYGNNARPFIITLNGWAGTQRYGGIWTGDQTGGQWEYIRFHIPTYLGSGLSGQPNISSDMDGIFGGKNIPVNIRDFQWKTFTPMQLNMDGWGSNEKYPQALGEPATSINRMYLKWKSELMPYAYSIAREAINGLPMIRAMFLSEPNTYTLGTATRYQFLYGPYFLVAPVYQNTKADSLGNDIRNTIYLPSGTWIDYFTGEQYAGNQIINNFNVPLWKLPVFIKKGAIIPLANPNNNVKEIAAGHRIYEIYPGNRERFVEYDDDGTTEGYLAGKFTTTAIQSEVSKETATILIEPTTGSFDGFEKNRSTEFRINTTAPPQKITAYIGSKKVTLKKVHSKEALRASDNSYYYDPAPELNQFATRDSAFSKVAIKKNPLLTVKLSKTDITKNRLQLVISKYIYSPPSTLLSKTGTLHAPPGFSAPDTFRTAYTLTPRWEPVQNADYYEIGFQDMIYSAIKDNSLIFDDLTPETAYSFKLRAVNKEGHSDWVTLQTVTKNDPLEFAIRGISGTTAVPSQGGDRIGKLFDFNEGTMWHTKWDTAATPFELVIDLKSVNQLDKLQYLPRDAGTNGIWQSGTVAYSRNKKDWTPAGTFSWERNHEIKEFIFNSKPTARYVKISIAEAAGKFGSGRELYLFKVPGTESYIPGDINNDGIIDNNDLTSYMNYTGLRKGDGDFEGYISKGDINGNGVIDAFDISNAAVELEGGARPKAGEAVSGSVTIATRKTQYQAGETIAVTVKGHQLENVNALNFAIPYSNQEYEYISIEPVNMDEMQNLTYDRLHSNGERVLYPTFINTGNKKTLNGNNELFIIKLKAKKPLRFNLKAVNGLLIDKNLGTAAF